MAQQSRVQYKQLPGTLDISFFAGDDFSMSINLGRDITDYTFDAGIVDYRGNGVVDFTIDTLSIASGIVNLSLSDTQTDDIPADSHYTFGWLQSGTATRTILAGKVILKDNNDD